MSREHPGPGCAIAQDDAGEQHAQSHGQVQGFDQADGHQHEAEQNGGGILVAQAQPAIQSADRLGQQHADEQPSAEQIQRMGDRQHPVVPVALVQHTQCQVHGDDGVDGVERRQDQQTGADLTLRITLGNHAHDDGG